MDEQGSGEKEDLRFEEVTIFYNFLFDIGDFVNPTDAARSLLKHEFALSSANYYNNDIEVAERFADLLKLRKEAQDIFEFTDIVKQKNYAEIVKQFIKRPEIAVKFFSTFINIYFKNSKVTKKNKNGAPKNLEDLLKSIDEPMIKIQWIEALERDIDRTLFAPHYINEIPFVRVGLQPFFINFAKEKLGIDAEVLIHRTGIAILRFTIIFNNQKTLEDIISFQASSLLFESLEIAQELTKFISAPIKPSTESRYSSGIYWAEYEASGDNKGTLVDIFELYQAAIISVILNKRPSKYDEPWSWLRSKTWLAYPVIFIGNTIPQFQNSTTLKERYSRELAGLILRYPGWMHLKDNIVEKTINSDLTIIEDYSLFIESGHSLIIYYKNKRDKLVERSKGKFPSPEWLSDYLNSSVLIDILLIQRWILNIFNDRAKTITLDLKNLVKLKKDILLGLEEYNGILLSYGSAQDIINQKKIDMGTVTLYERLKQKIEILEKLIDIEESKRRAQLDLLLKSSALFATAMLGLAGAWRMVEIIVEWDKLTSIVPDNWSRILVDIIDFVKSHQIGTALFLYSIPIITFLVIILWGINNGRKESIVITDQSSPAHESGFKWPVDIKIIHKK